MDIVQIEDPTGHPNTDLLASDSSTLHPQIIIFFGEIFYYLKPVIYFTYYYDGGKNHGQDYQYYFINRQK